MSKQHSRVRVLQLQVQLGADRLDVDGVVLQCFDFTERAHGTTRFAPNGRILLFTLVAEPCVRAEEESQPPCHELR